MSIGTRLSDAFVESLTAADDRSPRLSRKRPKSPESARPRRSTCSRRRTDALHSRFFQKARLSGYKPHWEVCHYRNGRSTC